jgi:hypothetical protein
VPKTISIDNVWIMQIRASVDPLGKAHIACEYQLRSGGSPIQSFSQDVTNLLSATDQAGALAFVKAVEQAVSADQGVTASATAQM